MVARIITSSRALSRLTERMIAVDSFAVRRSPSSSLAARTVSDGRTRESFAQRVSMAGAMWLNTLRYCQ